MKGNFIVGIICEYFKGDMSQSRGNKRDNAPRDGTQAVPWGFAGGCPGFHGCICFGIAKQVENNVPLKKGAKKDVPVFRHVLF